MSFKLAPQGVLSRGGPIWEWGRNKLAWAWRLIRAKPMGFAGIMVILLVVVLAIVGPTIAPYDPYVIRSKNLFEAPSTTFWFGTDDMGRDQLSRIIYGARVSIYVGLLASFTGASVGGIFGLFAAYKGGFVDDLTMRIMDVLMSFPTLALALAIIAVLGPSLNHAVIAIIVPFVPRATRVIRSQALSVKQAQYVDAARATGCGDGRIVFVHMMPNCMAPWLIMLTLYLGNAILTEAALSFLGLGVPPPRPSWGNMLSGAATNYAAVAPWMGIFPGFAITITVIGFNFFGDALRDLWDPKLRGR